MTEGYDQQQAQHLEEGWFFYDHAWMLAFHNMSRFVGKSVLDVGTLVESAVFNGFCFSVFKAKSDVGIGTIVGSAMLNIFVQAYLKSRVIQALEP